MRKSIVILMALLILLVSMPVSAGKNFHWDFEDGVDGQTFADGGTDVLATFDIIQGLGMRGYNDYWGPAFSSETPYGTGLSMDCSDGTSDGYIREDGSGAVVTSLITWTPSVYTIECKFMLTGLAGWQSFVARSGVGDHETGDTNLAAFYLQKMDTNYFRFSLATLGGERVIIDTQDAGLQVEANKWYRFAAVSDGSTLSLWVENITDGIAMQKYVETDLTGLIDPSMDSTGADWVFGRAWYDGNGDNITGYMDDVILADSALYPETIAYDSPAYGATLIPVALDAPENDLVFTVIDSDIADVEVYLSPDDPNAPDLIKTINSVGTGQQTVTLETELTSDLPFETDFYWKVVGYEPNTVSGLNDIPVPGPVWRFTTEPATPVVSDVVPAYIAVDAGEPSLVLSVTGSNVDTYQWYKEDVGALSNGTDYDGVDTDTLIIYDVQLADEGYYYCEGTNLVGSDTSASGRVMTKRLTSHYPFEVINTVKNDRVTPDIVGGFDAVLLEEGTAGLPVLSDANQLDPSLGTYLLLDNGDHATDPNGQYAKIPAGFADYEDITISAWIRPTDVGVWSRVFDFGNDTANYLFLTTDEGNYDTRFAMRTGSINEQQLTGAFDSSNWTAPGSWYHMVVTISGDTGRLYRNGELVDTNTSMTINPLDIAPTLNYLGKSQYDDPEFDGLIDELKIYNYALTTEEIGQDYLAIVGGWVCNYEIYDLGDYDYNGDCRIDLDDFASFAARWLEDDRIYPAP